MNKEGYDSIDDVMERGSKPMDPNEFEAAANATDALLLDTRDPNTFAQGFIPNSISIGLDGNFAPWVGALITDLKQPILLILEDDSRAEEAITRLSRVGYDNTIGYLKGGFQAWKDAGKQVDSVENIEPEKLAKQYGEADIIDIRKDSEYATGHVKGARNIPLDYINQNMASFKKDEKQYVHCAGGYRSMIASSILKARGYDNVVNILGGFGAIAETDVPQEEGLPETA